MNKNEIDNLRNQIDQVDDQLLDLLNQRADLANRIGHSKKSIDPNSEVYCPEREAKHLRELVKSNSGKLAGHSVIAVFREIMSACRALEKEIVVSYLGPKGTYTMEAAYLQFGYSVKLRSLYTIEEIFRSVEAEDSHYGVVPVENSSEGAISSTLDCFVDSSLHIIGEIKMRISHCLLSKEKSLESIEVIYSHEQSLAQCRKWISANLPECHKVSVSSNALAAQKSANEKNSAAIASNTAANIESVPIMVKNIEDHPDNTTRFLIIGRQPVQPSGNDKTSIIVSAQNHPGSLAGLLQILAKHQLSLSRIESRPAHTTNWEYLFFLDIQGHCESPEVMRGLDELKEKASFYKLLGSYPCAIG